MCCAAEGWHVSDVMRSDGDVRCSHEIFVPNRTAYVRVDGIGEYQMSMNEYSRAGPRGGRASLGADASHATTPSDLVSPLGPRPEPAARPFVEVCTRVRRHTIFIPCIQMTY